MCCLQHQQHHRVQVRYPRLCNWKGRGGSTRGIWGMGHLRFTQMPNTTTARQAHSSPWFCIGVDEHGGLQIPKAGKDNSGLILDVVMTVVLGLRGCPLALLLGMHIKPVFGLLQRGCRLLSRNSPAVAGVLSALQAGSLGEQPVLSIPACQANPPSSLPACSKREPVMHLYGLWYKYPARCATSPASRCWPGQPTPTGGWTSRGQRGRASACQRRGRRWVGVCVGGGGGGGGGFDIFRGTRDTLDRGAGGWGVDRFRHSWHNGWRTAAQCVGWLGWV
jgi:hypothetical protein